MKKKLRRCFLAFSPSQRPLTNFKKPGNSPRLAPLGVSVSDGHAGKYT